MFWLVAFIHHKYKFTPSSKTRLKTQAMTPKTSCLSAVFKTLCNSIILGGQERISGNELIYSQVPWITPQNSQATRGANSAQLYMFHDIPLYSHIVGCISSHIA